MFIAKINMKAFVLDPNADGTQWIYRDCIITEQILPKLLRYACYSNEGTFIGVSDTRMGCKKQIDLYLR